MNSKVALDYIEKINAGDVDGLVSLMSEHHRFIDPLGQVVRGRQDMRQGWIEYYKMFPNYHIDVQRVVEGTDTVGIFGTASATFSGNPDASEAERSWKIPTAWRAVVKDGLVLEWQVYTDNEPVWKILGIKRY